jgi:two-component system, response regulator
MEARLTILMVDDDDVDLELFDLAVKKTGLDIRLETLTAVKNAIDYLQAKGVYAYRSLHPWPDVVVLDLRMPGLNGFDFLAWRKESRIYSSNPVAVLSVSNNPVDAEMAAGMGANKFIVKPSGFEGWKKVVQEIWDIGNRRSLFSQAEQIRLSRGA